MIRILKILVLFTVLIFTGCDEPLGEKKTKYIVEKSKMDPRLKAYPEAVEWYKDSETYPEAAVNLGYFYDNTFKDYKKAIKWYTKAFEGGIKKASNNIGSAYVDLIDYNNALKWYKIALSKNIEESYYNIAFLYHTKLKDYAIAIKYYKTAIERESSLTSSIKGIAWLYHEDLKDDIKASAYMLNLIANGKEKNKTISFLKEKWNLSDETIKKGYELQLTMPGLPRRYKGGI